MADATGGGTPEEAPDENIESLARKLLRNADENGLEPGDIESARRVARRMLEDSEARVNDPATTDPEHEDVIRRTSSETSASGDSLSPRTNHGE